MLLQTAELSRHLANGIENRYLVFGKEPFLIESCGRMIRQQAQNHGFTERIPLNVSSDFDWNSLEDHLNNQSLFADKKLIELRFVDAIKPGRQGSGALVDALGYRDDSTLILIIGGEIDSSAKRAKWYESWQKDAVVIDNQPLKPDQFCNWIRTSLERKGITHASGVPEQLAYYFEGNMLAAANEIRKLALGYDQGTVSVEHIEQIVSDQGRFNVYILTEAYLAGNLDRSVRMLNGLKKEGLAPSFVLWALQREMRLVYQASFLLSKRQSIGQLMTKNRVWKSRQHQITGASRRLGLARSKQALKILAKLDRIIKGREPGYSTHSFWDEMERFALDVCH